MADYNLGPYRPRLRGDYDNKTPYRFFDQVKWLGGSYLNINPDTIDGDSCLGVPPTGAERSELNWICVAEKGDKGDMGDAYQDFMEVRDGKWDFSLSDKIFIPEGGRNIIEITNAYTGCCGIMLSIQDITVPQDSDFTYDYDYVDLDVNQYYMYSFVYANVPPTMRPKFIWHRTIVNMGNGGAP